MLTSVCFVTSLLQGAEELAIRKPLKSDFGGGMKEFVLEDQECFEGVSEESSFLTSQERQSILHHMLNNLRATEGEELDGVRFLEGQPIGQSLFVCSLYVFRACFACVFVCYDPNEGSLL